MCLTKPTVHGRVFEGNSSALEIAKVPKMRPRTKHINIKYHHFRDFVDRSEISINAINTKDQPANMLTKPFSKAVLSKHQKFIMDWGIRKTSNERECEDISDGSCQDHCKSESSSRNQARKVRFKLFPFVTYSDLPGLTYQAWPTMTYYTYLPCLPTGLSTTGPSYRNYPVSWPQIHFTMRSVQNWSHPHHCSSSTWFVQAASTPQDTLAIMWLVGGPKKVFFLLDIYQFQDLSFKYIFQLSIVFIFSFFSF